MSQEIVRQSVVGIWCPLRKRFEILQPISQLWGFFRLFKGLFEINNRMQNSQFSTDMCNVLALFSSVLPGLSLWTLGLGVAPGTSDVHATYSHRVHGVC